MEKEKRFISLTASSPWKGLDQWLDACFTEYKYHISPGQPTSTQLERVGWLHRGQQSCNSLLWVYSWNIKALCKP